MKIEIPLPYHLSGHSFYLRYLQRFVLGPVSKCVCACMFHVWKDLRVKKEDECHWCPEDFSQMWLSGFEFKFSIRVENSLNA